MEFVGKGRPIHDAREKAGGYAKYAADYDFPEMAHVAMIFSPVAHGTVKSVDDSAALAVEGVYGVFHCFNTTKKMFSHYRMQAALAGVLPDEELAFKRHVKYAGDRVAAVAARDLETARKAAALVKVEYEELPAALSIREALAGKHLPEGVSPLEEDFYKEYGEAPAPDPSAVEVVTHSGIARLHHAAMENHACLVNYDPYSDQMTIYSPNQAVHGLRSVIADYLEMPYSKVRVVKTTMGGSFGCKQEWFLEPVAALIARKLRRPVKLVYRREDSMLSTLVRAAMECTVRGLYSAEGKILSLDVDLCTDAGAYLGNTKDYIKALYGKFFRLYDVPCMRYHSRVVCANTPISGAFRSWSAAEAAIFFEQNLNKAAARLGIDPVELRLRNVLHPGDVDRNTKVPLEDYRAEESILLGRDRFEWEKKMAGDRAFNRENRRFRRGVGIGCSGHGNTYYPKHDDFACAELRVNEDGSVQAHISLHDHGCGTVQAFRMILAEALEMEEDKILVGEADTAHTPFDYGCFASRSTFVVGKAAQDCAQALRRAMIANAAEIEGLPEEDFCFDHAVLRSRSHPEISYTYGRIALDTTLKLRRELTVHWDHRNTSNPGVMGAHFAHVEVDTYTGMTRVLDYLAVHDIGQAINPDICVAQIQGAAQMGCGAALHEKLEANGRIVSSLSKYHLCLAPDLPEIQVELVQGGLSREGPYGAKSIGEVSYAPAAAAVCSAVNQALGSDIGTVPLDPPVILKHLSEEETPC